MIFRRQESFRYTFNTPVDCIFNITKIDEIPTDSQFGYGQIIDISPYGLKMITSLNMSPSFKKIDIDVRFSIDNRPFQVPGVIQWQKKELLKNAYLYGIKLESTEDIASSIIDGLKKHAEKTLKAKKSDE